MKNKYFNNLFVDENRTKKRKGKIHYKLNRLFLNKN